MNLASLLAVAAAGATPWSPPTVLSACPARPAAQVVFPSDSPAQATGAGAIVWSATAGCPGGEGARVATIGAGDEPGPATIPRTAADTTLAPRGPLLASGAPHGQIVIAGSSPGAPTQGQLIQGSAGGPFATLAPPEGSSTPVALAAAYLGDLALASPPARASRGATDGLDVHIERFFSHDFTRNVAAPLVEGAGPVRALTLAMDYRSEVLAVWVQGAGVYAELVPNQGPARPAQRLAPIGADPHVAVVLSDDNRAIVAWSARRGSQTSVYIDRSAVGVRFGAPELLERFQDPGGLSGPAASPTLVRLSSESVMLAWAGAAAGRWVVRTAPVYLSGVGAVSTIVAAGGDALLAGLAPGPGAEALLLWTEPEANAAGLADMERQAIFAARGFDAGQQRTVFGEPERVAAPAPVNDLDVALDPATDRAIAVWQSQSGEIYYSVRAAGAGP